MKRMIRKFFKRHFREDKPCREAYYNTYGEDCDNDCKNCPMNWY